jgi:hypothetical protein
MPDLKTHYAMMNAQEECVSRPFPAGVVIYHLYLKIIHSGLTIGEVLSMNDEDFGQFLGQGFQINCSAGIFPYEKDFVPGLCLSFFEGLTLGAVPTEDMVRTLSFLLCFHMASPCLCLCLCRVGHCPWRSWRAGPSATSGPSRSTRP